MKFYFRPSNSKTIEISMRTTNRFIGVKQDNVRPYDFVLNRKDVLNILKDSPTPEHVVEYLQHMLATLGPELP